MSFDLVLCESLTHRSIREDERTFARGRSRTEMEHLLITFCDEDAAGKRDWQAPRNWGQVQWERLSES